MELIRTTGNKRIFLSGLFFLFFFQLHGQENGLDSLNTLREAIVVADMSRNVHSSTGLISFSINDLRSTAAPLGEQDIMRYLQSLPGVVSTKEGRSGITVRGGEYDQNLIILDGMTLFNSEHLGGFVSSINPAIIDNVDFYRGSIPVKYGGRLSSVIDMKMREGDPSHFQGKLDIGLVSSGLTLEGPLSRTGRASFILGGRLSYFNKVAGRVMNKIYDDSTSLAPLLEMNYQDLSAKVVHHINNNNKLEAVFYRSYDKSVVSPSPEKSDLHIDLEEIFKSGSGPFFPNSDFDYTINKSSYQNNGLKSSWGNIAGGVTWKHQKENNGMTIAVSYVDYNYYNEKKEVDNSIEDWAEYRVNKGINETVKYRNLSLDSLNAYNLFKISDITFSLDLCSKRFDNHFFTFGASYQKTTVNSNQSLFRRLFTQNIWNVVHESITDESSHPVWGFSLLSGFLCDDWKIYDNLTASIGFRGSAYYSGKTIWPVVEPRLSLHYSDNFGFTSQLSYSRTSQGIHLLQDNGLYSLSDRWICLTDVIRPITSNIYCFGAARRIDQKWIISSELYLKTMDNLLEYKEGVSVLSLEWEKHLARGSGKAFGAEIMIERKHGSTTGRVDYSWSKATRLFNRPGEEINAGKTYYAASDLRHNLNIIVKQVLGVHFSLSALFIFQTGHRGTVPLTAMYGPRIGEKDYEENGFNHLLEERSIEYKGLRIMPGYTSNHTITSFQRFLLPDTINNFVMPSVHRLDIGGNYSFSTGKIQHSVNLSVCNVYNRLNVSYVFWGKEEGFPVLKGLCIFPIMPSISYSIDF